jgi:tetratricopeptide (TPR) repeat protein
MLKLFTLKRALVAFFVIAPLSFATFAAEEEDGPRKPPEARTSGTLGPQVMRAITEIQEMMSPEDEEDEPDLEGAKFALDELYERRYERMNDFEKSTILNFYTNYYLTTENYVEAVKIFEELLTIETLRADTRLRTLRSLGQLYAAEENWRNSIRYYEEWRDLSEVEDSVVFRGLSYAHYQLEEYLPARDFWLSYLDMKFNDREPVERDDYAYLNGLYFTLEDFESALDLTKTMIVKFDNKTDWQNLSAIYATLENDERRVQSLNLYYLKGLLDDETRFLNLGQSLAGIEVPYSGAKIIQEGLESEVIETNVDNMITFTQMLLIANELDAAVIPATQAAELDETGNAYDTLGYLHYVMNNYEEAAEAFRAAIEKGDLKDVSDTYLFLARALLELRLFDEAKDAASQASEAGDERSTKSAQDFLKLIESRRGYYAIIAQRKADAIDFYQGYPPLQ